jgi:hypothetical protein
MECASHTDAHISSLNTTMSRNVTVTVTANGEETTNDVVMIDGDDARGIERAVQASKEQAMGRLNGLMRARGVLVDAARESDGEENDEEEDGKDSV